MKETSPNALSFEHGDEEKLVKMDVWAYSKKSEQIKGELRMRISKHKKLQSAFFCFILLTLALSGEGFLGEKEDVSPLLSLLPQVEAWIFSGHLRTIFLNRFLNTSTVLLRYTWLTIFRS
jgi:hypothetical protein